MGTARRDEFVAQLDALPHREAARRQLAQTVAVYIFKGDQVAVNPSANEAVINPDLLPNTLYYRHDLASAQDPTIPKNPHLFILTPNSSNALVRAVSRGMQAQIADFHASGGTIVNIPTPTGLWEVPIVSPLDSLNFIR